LPRFRFCFGKVGVLTGMRALRCRIFDPNLSKTRACADADATVYPLIPNFN